MLVNNIFTCNHRYIISVLSANTDSSTGSVSVTVTDTNDQSPMFVGSSLFAVVAEEAPFGTTITTLQVRMFASLLLYAVYSYGDHHVIY